MAFTPQFLDELRTRIGLADVVGRRVRLTRKGHEHSGLCPFHKEKTPSFTVNEDKGFYHCFGCGEHGSAFDFVMKTDNLTFPEAVEQLAAEAGMQVPVDTPEERERSRQRQTLYEVMDGAAAFFERSLRLPEGKAALEYLHQRGLTDETIRTFRLGYSPDGRGILKGALSREGVTEDQLVAGGLVIQPDDPARGSYDRFRGRVMFPIADRRGRIIAFGGRYLEPAEGTGDAGQGDAKSIAKYLNSPETVLFHKGHVLYGLDRAATPARDVGSVIVTEGYMDVIALAQAGFTHAVAPLGTALTEDQIALLWKLVPEPVLCFDGDTAGARAAGRAAERALPLLRPGVSLRFAQIPTGEDPDSLIKGEGRGAMERVLAGSAPLSDVIWSMETAGRAARTPEQRAALQKRLDDHVRRIEDPTVRTHFSSGFRDRMWQSRPGNTNRGRNQGGGGNRGGNRGGNQGGTTSNDPTVTAESGLAVRVDPSRDAEKTLVSIIIEHPELFHDVEERFGSIGIRDRSLDGLRQALVAMLSGEPGFDADAVKQELSKRGLADSVDALYRDAMVRRWETLNPEARNDDFPDLWREIWEQNYHQIKKADYRHEVESQSHRDEYSDEDLQRLMEIKRAEINEEETG